jgi:hypothetical protein
MGSFYPWSVLGLSPQAGESEIKKAYARLLRLNRPDEDPEGFQALVEARDMAMAYARRAAAQKRQMTPRDESTAPGSAPDRAPGSPAELTAPVLEAFPPPQPSPPPPPLPTAPNPLPQTEERSNIPPLAEPDFADLLEQKPGDGRIPEPQRESAPPPEPSLLMPVPPAQAPALPPPEPDLNPRQIADTIVAGLSLFADEMQLNDAAKAAARLHEFSLWERRQAEPRLIEAVLPRLPVISTRLMMGRPGLFGRIAAMFRKADPESDARARAQLELILLLNEEFGWTASDRRVYELAGRDKASAAMLYLNAFERAAKVAKAAASKSANPAPVLEERDARSAFGAEYSFYAPLLAKVRAGTRLPVLWNTGIFLFLPLWLISRGLYRPSFLWAAAVLTGIGYAQLDIPYAKEWPLVRFAGWLPLLALHFFAGAYAYQWTIQRAVARIACADRAALFDPAKRSAFLSRQSKAVIRPLPSGRYWAWWAAAWFLFWLLKGLITASQH